ncbi:MAG: hypothetical protein P4M05_16880 [Bradyrhizobium sp.]|nr:hypothetical protein [Bradyrhizobium sp.]
MTVTVVPWALSAGRICASCLAQSCRSRTDNGHDRCQNLVFFSARISPRNGAFFDDIVDHEFESLVNNVAPLQPTESMSIFKYLKFHKKYGCATVSTGQQG